MERETEQVGWQPYLDWARQVVRTDSQMRWRLVRDHASVAPDPELKAIKRYMARRHGVDFPPIDIAYSDSTAFSWLVLPSKATPVGGLLWRIYTQDTFGLDLDPTRYTIILPTRQAMRQRILLEYKDLNRQVREGADRDELLATHGWALTLSGLYNSPKLFWHASRWHEMGHLLAPLFGIPGVGKENRVAQEVVAMAYLFKGVCLAVREGKFAAQDVLRMADSMAKLYAADDDLHRLGFELFMGDLSLDRGLGELEGRADEVLEAMLRKRVMGWER